MFSILFTIGCRSDAGLSLPIIRRLEKESWCNVSVLDLEPQCFSISYARTEDYFTVHGKPDLIFITGDRVETCAAAACAFHNNVKICHMYAGSTNTISTFDDVDRHCISLWADLCLCESREAQEVVWDLKKAVGLPVNSFDVGITHLDDLCVDECKVPLTVSPMPESELIKVPYDLILYNTPTKTDYSKDIAAIRELIKGSYSVLVSGNPDGDAEAELVEYVDEVHIDLSRARFLGLLKNCNRFIGNSSSAIYEAPYFLKPEQIIHIGERNRNRSKVEAIHGGSEKVVEVLRAYARGL